MSEQTLVLVKPDGVKGGHIGDVIDRFEDRNYEILDLTVTEASLRQLQDHYAHVKDKPFFPEIVSYMQETPITAMIVGGTNIVNVAHKIAGSTNPDDAILGTIRGDFGRQWDDGIIRNVIHTSDTVENAEREIKIWFPERQYQTLREFVLYGPIERLTEDQYEKLSETDYERYFSAYRQHRRGMAQKRVAEKE